MTTQTETDLTGQVAIVTGAARGLGRAYASALSGAGATLALVDLREEQLAETAALVGGSRALPLIVDVTDWRAVEAAVTRAEERLGPIDVLVNNAGIDIPAGRFWEQDPEAWWRVIEVHLRGTMLCCRAVLPGMIARGGGRIINIGSNVGIAPEPQFSAYSCAKAALLRLTDTLAAATREHGVSIFAISPGTVRTALTEGWYQSLLAAVPPERRAPDWLPEDWSPPELAAALVVFLASGKADRLSGRYIHAREGNADELVRRADQIERQDLFVLRLRK